MSDDDTALWLVFTKPVEGMEDEYDTWYDEVHLPDVVAVPGVRSGQRFVIGPERRPPDEEPAFRNLTVYELEGEPGDCAVRVASTRAQVDVTASRGGPGLLTTRSRW